jgi:hypothetical protein
MALDQVSSENKLQLFHSKFMQEYFRKNQFSPYMGKSENSIIVTRSIPKGTDQIPIVFDMDGEGVAGDQPLGGNEEPLNDTNMTLRPRIRRNAFTLGEDAKKDTMLDLLQAGRSKLMRWGQDLQRHDAIRAMMMIQDAGTFYDYGKSNKRGFPAAAAANLDAWNANNSDRILYGEAKSNIVEGDHTASLANITTATGKMSAATISIAKRMARTASPKIHPTRVSGQKEWFICFHDPYAFRDLKSDAAITAAQREVNGRGTPLFEDGEIQYEGVIHVEIPELADYVDGSAGAHGGYWGSRAAADGLNSAGDSSSRVGVSILCGSQAIAYGSRRTPMMPPKREDDYGHFQGIGFSAFHQFQKFFFENKQHGMVTIFSSAAGDA